VEPAMKKHFQFQIAPSCVYVCSVCPLNSSHSDQNPYNPDIYDYIIMFYIILTLSKDQRKEINERKSE